MIEPPASDDWGNEDDAGPTNGHANGHHPTEQAPALRTVCLADVGPEHVTWLWAGRVPAGKVTLLDGDPGLGKSTISLDLVARVSTGAPMPGEVTVRPAAGALILSAEDGLADTIRPRLDAAGADVTRVVAITGVPEGDHDRPPSLPLDLPAIEAEIRRIGACLVIVDPLMAYLGGEVDSHKDQDVRRAMAPLAQMAERTGAAILIVRHLNKSGGRSAIYRGGGSIGIVGAARMGLLVARDPDDRDCRILAATKSNLAAPAPALRWRLVSTDSGVARVEWLGEVDVSADDLVHRRTRRPRRVDRPRPRLRAGSGKSSPRARSPSRSCSSPGAKKGTQSGPFGGSGRPSMSCSSGSGRAATIGRSGDSGQRRMHKGGLTGAASESRTNGATPLISEMISKVSTPAYPNPANGKGDGMTGFDPDDEGVLL